MCIARKLWTLLLYSSSEVEIVLAVSWQDNRRCPKWFLRSSTKKFARFGAKCIVGQVEEACTGLFLDVMKAMDEILYLLEASGQNHKTCLRVIKVDNLVVAGVIVAVAPGVAGVVIGVVARICGTQQMVGSLHRQQMLNEGEGSWLLTSSMKLCHGSHGEVEKHQD